MKNYMSEKIQSGKQAGKNGLQHVIYGRTLIVLILVLLQIAGLVAISQLLQGRSMLVYYGFVAIGYEDCVDCADSGGASSRYRLLLLYSVADGCTQDE